MFDFKFGMLIGGEVEVIVIKVFELKVSFFLLEMLK